MTWFAWLTVGLIVARALAQLWLSRLNRQHVLAHADAVPAAFGEIIDPSTYAKSVQYTLAKSQYHEVEIAWDTVLLLLLLFSGVLPAVFNGFTNQFGTS